MFSAAASRPVLACFGVACHLHADCARYAAVGLSQADPSTLVSCRDGMRFPLFAPIVRVFPVAA